MSIFKLFYHTGMFPARIPACKKPKKIFHLLRLLTYAFCFCLLFVPALYMQPAHPPEQLEQPEQPAHPALLPFRGSTFFSARMTRCKTIARTRILAQLAASHIIICFPPFPVCYILSHSKRTDKFRRRPFPSVSDADHHRGSSVRRDR